MIGYLRAVGRSLHLELGGPGVGAVGMCFSGGFALAMMVDDTVVAPVLSQPSLPFAVGKARAANLGLSPDDALVVAERAADGCPVMGLRFTGDKFVGSRFETLRTLLGDAFRAVEFPSATGSDHSVLTEQRQEKARPACLAFFRERLVRRRPARRPSAAGSRPCRWGPGARLDEDHPLRRLEAGELGLDVGDDRRLVHRPHRLRRHTALTAWPKRSSSTPTTRQSITPATRLTASSTSSGKIFSPPELITLLPRPSRIREPSAATLAMSPGNE